MKFEIPSKYQVGGQVMSVQLVEKIENTSTMNTNPQQKLAKVEEQIQLLQAKQKRLQDEIQILKKRKYNLEYHIQNYKTHKPKKRNIYTILDEIASKQKRQETLNSIFDEITEKYG